MTKNKVAIIMGSTSDLPKMEKAPKILKELGIETTIKIYSAHRTPKELSDYIKKINQEDSFKVIISGAGMSAALSGAIASQTLKPVVGVPLSGKLLNGMDALLSTVQMPPGIPVAAVGVDAVKNAALLAAQIIAVSDPEVKQKINEFRNRQAQEVLVANDNLTV